MDDRDRSGAKAAPARLAGTDRPARLRLMGGFNLLAADGAEVVLSSRRGSALLAYLALTPGHAARRERLCGLLWSDRGEPQARASLRQCLFELRQALMAADLDVLDVGRDKVALNPDRLASDAADIEQALARGDVGDLVAALRAAGGGRLLEGMEFSGLFGDWLDQTRAQLERSMAGGVHEHLRRLTGDSLWAEARTLAETWLRRDPLDETAVAVAIKADAVSGAPAAARRRFESFKTILQKELGVAPGEVVTEAMAWLDESSAARSGGARRPDEKPPEVEAPEPVRDETDRRAATISQPERRRLTILSCGLADGEGLSRRLDPEQWHAVASRFQRVVVEAVAPMDGFVAKSLAEGSLIYFGYPEAREDAAECAVRAGLEILEATRALNADLASALSEALQARVGLHAGPVVVAPDDDGDVAVFGDAAGIAHAVRSVAAPDTVAMTERVHELVSGRFVIEELAVKVLAGDVEPMMLYRAIRPGLMGRRGFSGGRKTRFVGRGEEMRSLMARWRRVRDEGQLVFVSGEAGVGKTRLIEEFRSRIRAEPHLWIEGACGPAFANTPFHPVMQLLRQGLEWRRDEAPEQLLRRLEQALRPSGMRLAEVAPVIADFLGLPTPAGYPPLTLAPEQRRRVLIAALAGWVLSATGDQPLVIVLEDVQWVDPSTLEVMQTLALQGSSAPLLLLCVARPEFRPPWPLRAHHSQITLGRLSRGETDQLVRGVSASDGLSGSEIEGVIDRADGVPLFAEELTRFMLEGAGRGAPREIPATLFDSLAARLDRLGSAREVAQLGAVLGREFSYELISAVSSAPEHQLQADLEKLVDGDVILARGLPPYANYMFKHALLQDAAYGALLKSRRRELHASVARTITAEFTSLAHTQPEILARHWTEAGEAGPAVAAWSVAGESALARRAFKEAEGAFRSAVDILLGEEASPERDAQELALVSQLARVLVLTRGYAAPETVEAAGRAKALAEEFGSVSQLIREEGRIWQATVTAGDYAGAAALADHIMDLARGDGESPQRLIFAHNAQLQTRFYTGDLAGVEEHFALMSPVIDQAGARQAPGNNVISIGVASLSAWSLGHSDVAHERAARAAAMAERSQHPYDLAMSLHFQGLLHVCERDAEGAASAAERLLALAEANGLDYAGDLARATLGWARARLGATKIGLELLIRVRAESTGARVGLTFGLTMAAEVQALAGQYQRTLEVFEEALTANPQERVFRPFTLAARAEFLTAQGDAAAAEANFRDAVATARTMGAKAWEWRATAGLARLLAARGAAAAGRELVEPLLAEGAGHGREIAELARELGLRPA